MEIGEHFSALDAYERAQEWDGLFKILLNLRKKSEILPETHKYLMMVLNGIQK